MMQSDNPIGVLDSGVGGISVLKELMLALPHENYIYFGDSLYAPYGARSAEDVCALTVNNVHKLLCRKAKAIVIACNTATSVAAAYLRQLYPNMPIIGMEPALKPAVESACGGCVLVMATPVTLRQEKFLSLREKFAAQSTIIDLPCPGLVELIEQGHTCDSVLKAFLMQLLKPYLQEPVDAIVLGCTHYAHIKETLLSCFDQPPHIFDGISGTVRETTRRLAEVNLLNRQEKAGCLTIMNSKDDPALLDLCRSLLQKEGPAECF